MLWNSNEHRILLRLSKHYILLWLSFFSIVSWLSRCDLKTRLPNSLPLETAPRVRPVPGVSRQSALHRHKRDQAVFSEPSFKFYTCTSEGRFEFCSAPWWLVEDEAKLVIFCWFGGDVEKSVGPCQASPNEARPCYLSARALELLTQGHRPPDTNSILLLTLIRTVTQWGKS